MQPLHGSPGPERQRVAHRVVVEATSDEHARFGVGEFGDQRRTQPIGVDLGECRGQLVLRGFAVASVGAFGDVREMCQAPALRRGDGRGDASRDHGASCECGVEREPRQIRAHMEPVEPVRDGVRPEPHGHNDCRDERENEDCQCTECHERTSRTRPAPTVTVSYTRRICSATTGQS